VLTTKSRARESTLAIYLGLITNVFLAILKTTVGVLGHSPALLADGINSTSDVAYYIVVGIFMHKSNKPPDEEHPYGHRQLESIAALLVGSFVITTAIAIFWNSIDAIYDLVIGISEFSGASQAALWVALFTILLKWGLSVYTRGVGESHHNAAVLALARDHRNDLYSAAAAAIGIFLGRQGILWVDPLAGALVAFIILHTGIEILRESSAELMDDVPSKALAEEITALLHQHTDGVVIEELRAHRFGPHLVVNLTIGIDGSLTVTEGDAISTQVEYLLHENIDYLRQVYVHYHPIGSAMTLDARGNPIRETERHSSEIAEKMWRDGVP
jgi:cation diffusion facilitator family transporter